MAILPGSDPVILASTTGSVTEGPLTHRIFKEEDFPGFITGTSIILPDSVNIIHDDITLGIDENFINEVGGSTIQFVSEFKRKYRIISNDISAPLFLLNDSDSLDIRSVTFLMNGFGGNFISMDLSGSLRMDDSVVNLLGSARIGEFTNSGSFQHLFCSFIGFLTGVAATDTGLLLKNIADIQIIGNRYQSALTSTGSLIRIEGSSGMAGRMISNLFEEVIGGSVLYISPILDGTLLIAENTFNGDGDFFETGATGEITEIDDESFVDFTVSSVTDSSGGARFNHSSTLDTNGWLVTLSGFSETSYNTTGFIVFSSVGSFEVVAEDTGLLVSFVSDDTGTFNTDAVAIVSAGHSLSNGDILSIRGTINYNGGYIIFDATTNAFFINLRKDFPGMESSGEWDTGSLDQRDPRIECRGNRATEGGNFLRDSMVTGGWSVSGNVTETLVEDGSYVDMNFTGLSGLSYNERITASDPVTGEIRYDGLNSKVIKIPLTFRLSPVGGGARDYKIKGLLNGSNLPDNIETDIEAQGSGTDQTVTVSRTVLMENGDTFKWQVVGVSNALHLIAVNADIQI